MYANCVAVSLTSLPKDILVEETVWICIQDIIKTYLKSLEALRRRRPTKEVMTIQVRQQLTWRETQELSPEPPWTTLQAKWSRCVQDPRAPQCTLTEAAKRHLILCGGPEGFLLGPELMVPGILILQISINTRTPSDKDQGYQGLHTGHLSKSFT